MRNPSTKQHKAGEILCDGADRVVMLTATPVQTALKNLSSLLLLLLPDEFQDERVVEERLRINEKIVLAQNCLGKIPPDFESAYHHLCAVKNLPWFANNPLADSEAETPTYMGSESSTLMAYAAGDVAGKILAIFFPIWLFVVSGFEYSIANMYYIPH